jgi:hypothetical protein
MLLVLFEFFFFIDLAAQESEIGCAGCEPFFSPYSFWRTGFPS